MSCLRDAIKVAGIDIDEFEKVFVKTIQLYECEYNRGMKIDFVYTLKGVEPVKPMVETMEVR